MSIYQNLRSLLSGDARAHKYFSELPEIAQQSVKARDKDIRSYTELKQFASLYCGNNG